MSSSLSTKTFWACTKETQMRRKRYVGQHCMREFAIKQYAIRVLHSHLENKYRLAIFVVKEIKGYCMIIVGTYSDIKMFAEKCLRKALSIFFGKLE